MTDIQSMANAIRFLALDSILNAGEGHQGVPLGMAEIAATLYARHLKANPDDPQWHDRDRVVLSNGHGSLLLYSLLNLSGYKPVTVEALKTFRRLGSVCAGHPEIEQHAGIEITTGMLGQGIACAVGMAVAESRLAGEFGDDLVDHRTWAFVGDGCLQEGVGQEAISLAGHLRLGKLTFLWDDNQITDDGSTDLALSEDVPARFRAAGWQVQSVDGHDIEAISKALDAAKADPRPSLLACHTTIARGIPRLQGQRGGHSAPLVPQDRVEACKMLGWNHGAFDIPDSIRADWHTAMDRGRVAQADWQQRLSTAPTAVEFQRWQAGDLPQFHATTMAALKADSVAHDAPRPTILSSGDVCDGLNTDLPELQVLCADLEAPTNHKRSRRAFSATVQNGSYVHCGVREHLMGAMACGIAAHGGLRPVNVTYLAFADYERPAMRMAALMGLPALFAFSHDSIGVGSNGPTHQPVEILASFRSMPNFHVFRPADALETVEAWELAMARRDGPCLFALSRQPAAPLPVRSGENLTAKGAYLVSPPDEQRDITLIATGTEVGVALDARTKLKASGICAAVVSMPSWELFAAQPDAYRADVLGTVPRIGIEAALRFGWDRWLRPDDPFVGMTGFGASDKSETLYAHFGITADNVAQVARDRLSV
ncbi:transketolase [Oceaniovalibus sp. ACAM 378]|uniref:transketolase family protein n=1 Tax=Oceaniovalibus sp. ACAM 378 TaxID=2599923 RepID=UPI0011DBA779|nr:transketolase [Oceaniovalibus sp. ACAM 378]TYB84043.1 transketolase [Oceaniovalibus sp. ACAM 378]